RQAKRDLRQITTGHGADIFCEQVGGYVSTRQTYYHRGCSFALSQLQIRREDRYRSIAVRYHWIPRTKRWERISRKQNCIERGRLIRIGTGLIGQQLNGRRIGNCPSKINGLRTILSAQGRRRWRENMAGLVRCEQDGRTISCD